jgi:hypothetical protein
MSGDNDGRLRFPGIPAEDFNDFETVLRIEARRRFIGQKEERVVGDGPGDRHALFFPLTELGGGLRAKVPDPDPDKDSLRDSS